MAGRRRPRVQRERRTPIAKDMFLPNHSGDHSRGRVNTTPVQDTDLVNKAYVDASVTGTSVNVSANGVTLNDGNSTDTVADLQVLLDGNNYHVNEEAGVPGLDLEVDFTGVTAINKIVIKAYYNGSATHGVRVQLYNYTTTSWDTIHTLNSKEDFEQSFKSIPDDTDYISATNAIIRFYHTESGTASHDLYVDWCGLQYSTSTSTLAHGDLAGGIGTNTHAVIDTHLALSRSWDFTIVNPNSVQDTTNEIFIAWAMEDLTITKVQVELDISSQEVTGDIKHAADFLALGSATVINDFDTTSGKRTDTSITSASVAQGKAVYLSYDAQPHADIKQMHVHIEWDYD